ncbi:hypothetical protein SEA_OTTERSTEDTS21_51 [Gordonia phage OtterstedtS21]|uniref:Uncharacterized protein n=5 Tax=Lambovirus TaxID=2843412 RepID=A0A9E7QR23_9CAUD|nr:hypothetical protein HWC68_gp53 [Gordonia phage Gibbin]YP_009852703.1 hypothetical protein HWC71_gp52 [Gordonia phage Sadboi]YP_009854007.1 hypothetical protein HWC82_gp53 [Gordonia phage Yikes]QFG08190.1 hypothetical protein PBI_GRETELLYN_51 [Gordonia phage GretelLyn]UVT31214.1 hypothetical protein SEA_OTTERSTEDTS21_51 [Gordonia phage OtterstedtS21]QFG10593.1 hypothetical protein PBI_GIBBIN_53 [Gordonia phage Gibbin]QFG14702.1 hypothetical protein PBI_SADBOI_52 [Gordonia phage Sadboi]QGJ
MTTKKTNMWYVAQKENGKMTGFTSQPKMAEKDADGNPVVCPGDMRRVWDAEYARIKARRERIWEMLLDTMEEKYELQEKSGTMPDDQKIVDARIDAFQCALAVLELPFGKYDQDPTAAIQTIENKAIQKYEAEAE